MNTNNITFSTSWYILKSKFDKSKYEKWFSNYLKNVKNHNLVVYTNEESQTMLLPYIQDNPNIKLIIFNIEEFYNYQYREKWIQNHTKNNLLNNNSGFKTDWKLNMLWSEKLSFVKKTIDENYFDTQWYGWCDIGYFRGTSRDISINKIQFWPNHKKIEKLDKEKIHYAQISYNMNNIYRVIIDKNEQGLPKQQIPPNQVSIAGGFFLITKENINWWHKTYDDKLKLYFENNYLVKDDQMIIINCIFENLYKFKLWQENDSKFDKWFMFQRILL